MPLDPTPSDSRVAKRRRHGYRGYGSPLRHEHAGSIHWGKGFGGVGITQDASLLPPQPDLLPEELRERFPRGRK
jgi:hypothetical protein